VKAGASPSPLCHQSSVMVVLPLSGTSCARKPECVFNIA